MKFTFASFAALSLSATQAAQLRKDLGAPLVPHAEPKLAAIPPAQKELMSSTTNSAIMSLQRAFDNTQKEEKLLNEINSEIKQYWKMTSESEKFVQIDKPKHNSEAAQTQECHGANCHPVKKPASDQGAQIKKSSNDPGASTQSHQEQIQLDKDDDQDG